MSNELYKINLKEGEECCFVAEGNTGGTWTDWKDLGDLLSELAELRAYKEAAEKQEPSCYVVIAKGISFYTGTLEEAEHRAAALVWRSEETPTIRPLYANPVPDDQVPDAIQLLQRVAASTTDKPASDNGTGSVLWSDTHSEDEILEDHSDNVLFDVVANLWADIRCLKEDKSAVAVPDFETYWRSLPSYRDADKPAAKMAWDHLAGIIAAAPSHNQRSADTVPDDKPVTRQDVLDVLLSTRGQSEGVTADAILGLFDKPAVAVPDDVGMIPMINGKPKVTGRMKVECIGEFSWREEAPYYDENGELHDHVATHEVPWGVCKEIYKRMASAALLAAPSHSQQSVVPDYAKIIRDLAQEFKEAWPDDNGKYAWLIGYSDELKSGAPHSQQSVHPDDIAVDQFADVMKHKLAKARDKGRSGWENPSLCKVSDLAAMLADHLPKGDPVDVANFAMMLFFREGGNDALKDVCKFINSQQSAESDIEIVQTALDKTGLELRVGKDWILVCGEDEYSSDDALEVYYKDWAALLTWAKQAVIDRCPSHESEQGGVG